MAQKYFEEEKSQISFSTFAFTIGMIFTLGLMIGEYHAKKHLKDLPKCSVQQLQKAPKELPNGQAIHDIKKLEVFINGANK